MPTALIADDQDINRMVLVKLLSRAGYHVIEASDGWQALEEARNHAPDVAVIDLLMPGSDGFDFVHALRQEKGPIAHLPVVFISAAFLPTEASTLARSCGVTHVLSRTESADELLAMVDAAMKEPVTDSAVPGRGEFSVEHLKILTSKLSDEVRTLVYELSSAGHSEGEEGPRRKY